MALSLENQNYVWQRVASLQSVMHPDVAKQFKALREALSQSKRNIQLQLLTFTGAQSVAAGGTVLLDGACTVYAVYVKKNGTTGANGNTTAAAIKIYDDATNDGTAGDAKLGVGVLTTNDEAALTHPVGFAFGTGVVVTGHVNFAATTDSAAGDGGQGFVIVGA